MNNPQFEQLIFKHNATTDLKRFAMLKSWAQFYNECQRADWLLWLYYTTQIKQDNAFTLYLLQFDCISLLTEKLKIEEWTKIFNATIYADYKNIMEKQFNYIQRYYYECTGKDERLQYINKQLIDMVKKSLPIDHFHF